VYTIWNWGYRQGTTGSSLGKSMLKFKVVSEKTGQPIGFGMSTVRQITHVVDGLFCYIGYLFPLWDAKRQTLADKIMNTVCLPLRWTCSAEGASRTWHTNGRGVEQLTYTFALIDTLPWGRHEEWQDSPDGWPKRATYSGWLDSPDIAALYGQ
jgi:RDD family/Bacterial protein of unknown function (DUF899)